MARARRRPGGDPRAARPRPVDVVRLFVGWAARRAVLPRAPGTRGAARVGGARVPDGAIPVPIRASVGRAVQYTGDRARAGRAAHQRAAQPRPRSLPPARVRVVGGGILPRSARRRTLDAVSRYREDTAGGLE